MMDCKHGNAKDGAERARRALDGLKHCMPEGKDGGGCGGCPYMEKKRLRVRGSGDGVSADGHG